jgi:branched-chain amino acid transport system substrate-binding protein
MPLSWPQAHENVKGGAQMERNKSKKRFYLGIVLGIVFVLKVFTITALAEELKIGAIATATGPGTQWGRAVLHGVEMAAEDVNKVGGLKVKGKDYTIKVVNYDDEYTGKGGLSAATRLIFEDKVKFIVGPIGTAPRMAIKDLIEKNKTVNMMGSYSRKALDKDTSFAFRVFVTPEEFAPIFCKWLRQNYPNVKRVAIPAPNDETGWETQSEDIAGYEMNGFQVVFKEFYERGAKDFFPLLTKMMAMNPEILELDGNSPGDCGLIVKQARQMGFKGMIAKVGGPVTEELVKIAGKESVEGSIVFVPFDPKEPRIDAFMKRYEAKYHARMNSFLPSFYDATKVLFHAIERAGTVDDTEKVVKALEEVDFGKYKEGLTGPIGWTGKKSYGVNHQAIQKIAVAKIVDGQEIVIATLGEM